MDTQNNWEKTFAIQIPTRIEFGWGAAARLGEIVSELGQNCLVLTEVPLLGFSVVREILDALEAAGCSLEVYTDVESEATVTSIDRAAVLIGKLPLDCIIAIGGGSVMDFGKALSILLSHQGLIWDFVGYAGKLPRPIEKELLPLVTVPTTAGTGSEVTPYAVLVNLALDAKATVLSPAIAPHTAVVDPALTVSLPSEITAYTGADALAQCLESYLNLPSRTPFSALLNLEGIHAAGEALAAAVKNPEDRRARTLMSWASLLGGISISQAGTGLGHAVAEALGGLTHLPHGKTVALLLPAVLRMLEVDHSLDFPQLRQALGDASLPAYQQVARLWKEVDLPTTAADLDLAQEFRPILRQEILTNAGWAMAPNPIHLEEDDLDRVLAYLWEEPSG